MEYRSEACAASYTSPVGNKKEEADAPARQWVDSARSTGIGVCFLYFAESRGAKAVRAESSDSWEGAASIALAVRTLGLGASVSSVHPRSAGQITTRFVPEKRLA